MYSIKILVLYFSFFIIKYYAIFSIYNCVLYFFFKIVEYFSWFLIFLMLKRKKVWWKPKGEEMLLCKNVIVNGRRTSMRLDRETWLSLADICFREKVTIHELCSKIDSIKGRSGLSSATRLFVLTYFRYILSKYEKESFAFPREFNPDEVFKKIS